MITLAYLGIFLWGLGYFVDKVGSLWLDYRWRSLYEHKGKHKGNV